MKSATELFAELDNRLDAFGTDRPSRMAIEEAMRDNAWFTREDIATAIDAIRRCMLQRDAIERWLNAYPALVASHPPKKIGIVMAGNLPLVGFFDLMCVVASGNEAYIKTSSKDAPLMELIVRYLTDADPTLHIGRLEDDTPIDAVIATGGESAKLHFESKYADTPHIIRGSRHSVAVLSGNETEMELAGLADDMFLYAGLGCRNISLVFVPRGYSLHLPPRKMCNGYRNNYLQTRALLTMAGAAFDDNGTALFVRSSKPDFPNRLSRINIAEYDDIATVKAWLEDNDDRLQCVASSIERLHPRSVALGRTQYPTLTDYADNADTMAFLQTVVGY
ncbi:MAG: acyl-CoA reductase [Alistipes sp.]